MKVLIDTNVILDVLCNRSEYVEDSLKVFKCCEVNQITGCISALSILDMIYIMRNEPDREKIKETLDALNSIFSVAVLSQSDIDNVAILGFADYEDALQSVFAARAKADYIVTRNIRGFRNSTVPAITPSELLEMI